MKRILALILSLAMLCTVFASLAEAMEPLYATIGDALAASGERRIAGGEDDYYAVVTEIDGKFYRSVAETDARYAELHQAISDADPEQLEAAFDALAEHIMTLPISYSEMFTAVPADQADLDALIGKTIGDLRDAGYEDRESGTEGDLIVFVLRSGLFDYCFGVDADFDAYEKAMEDENSGGSLVINSAGYRGITGDACYKRFHTDGTIEETPDPFEGYSELITEVMELLQRAQNGEEVDFDAFFAGLKEKYPNLADFIDMYMELYRALGLDGLLSMMTPAE